MSLNGLTKTLDASFGGAHRESSYMVFASTENLKYFECEFTGHKLFTCPHKQHSGASKRSCGQWCSDIEVSGNYEVCSEAGESAEQCRRLLCV